MSHDKARFERNTDAGLEIVRNTYAQRGTEYGDTWENAPLLAIKAVAATMDIDLTHQQARQLVAAALYDIKYARLEGGWKEDSVVDGVAYGGNLIGEMRERERVLTTAEHEIGAGVA